MRSKCSLEIFEGNVSALSDRKSVQNAVEDGEEDEILIPKTKLGACYSCPRVLLLSTGEVIGVDGASIARV